MTKLLVYCAVALLSACVAPNGRLAAQLDNYHGRNVRDLVAILGAPSAKTAAAEQEVYVWGDPRLALLPQMSAGTPASTGAGSAQPSCTIRVFVAPDQRITSWDLLGNEATCQPYIARLSGTH